MVTGVGCAFCRPFVRRSQAEGRRDGSPRAVGVRQRSAERRKVVGAVRRGRARRLRGRFAQPKQAVLPAAPGRWRSRHGRGTCANTGQFLMAISGNRLSARRLCVIMAAAQGASWLYCAARLGPPYSCPRPLALQVLAWHLRVGPYLIQNVML